MIQFLHFIYIISSNFLSHKEILNFDCKKISEHLYDTSKHIDKSDGYSNLNTVIERRYHIGDFAQGGVVIWITDDGRHGLVAAIEDASSGEKWCIHPYPPFPKTGAIFKNGLPSSTPIKPYSAYYSGYQNQNMIKNQTKTLKDFPAFYCASSYTFNADGMTYSDWFLPSSSELSLMYALRDIINKISRMHGGSGMLDKINDPAYWSSREYQDNYHYAWLLHFATGFQYHLSKEHSFAVRCVRAF